jgi:hypothetical protein
MKKGVDLVEGGEDSRNQARVMLEQAHNLQSGSLRTGSSSITTPQQCAHNIGKGMVFKYQCHGELKLKG